jgi:hypothetical protein
MARPPEVETSGSTSSTSRLVKVERWPGKSVALKAQASIEIPSQISGEIMSHWYDG